MVCIPCIIAPVLLFIWYRFIQPIVLKIWNPWEPQKSVKSSQTNDAEKKCPFTSKSEAEVQESSDVTVKDSAMKKSD